MDYVLDFSENSIPLPHLVGSVQDCASHELSLAHTSNTAQTRRATTSGEGRGRLSR